jgi:hypothetical protein
MITKEEWDKICEEAIDCSRYDNAQMKHEVISYKIAWD